MAIAAEESRLLEAEDRACVQALYPVLDQY